LKQDIDIIGLLYRTGLSFFPFFITTQKKNSLPGAILETLKEQKDN
jgi:hypothetical protein